MITTDVFLAPPILQTALTTILRCYKHNRLWRATENANKRCCI